MLPPLRWSVSSRCPTAVRAGAESHSGERTIVRSAVRLEGEGSQESFRWDTEVDKSQGSMGSQEAQLLLQAAFSSFTQASGVLEQSYSELLEKVHLLSGELEQTNYYLSSVLESLPCGVVVLGSDGRVTAANPTARRLLSLSTASTPCDLEALLTASYYENELRAFFLSEVEPRELSLEREQGERSMLTCAWSAMRNRERVVVIQDVTEVKRLQDQMRETERLAAMGEMAVELAHEIRNPLSSLELFASLLREDDASAQERGGYLDNLQIGIRSLNTILSNMLCFSRNPVPSREPIVISGLLAEVFSFLGPLLERRKIEVVWDKADCRTLELDPEMMHQVFTNLALNALQALPEGGRIYLRTSDAQDGVTVSIRDDGLGIPQPYQADIFEPQFSTNRNGNGLGLAIVQRLVQAHNGHIAVESREGWGTCSACRNWMGWNS